MADFVQTMKDWKRMCNAMGQEDEYTACDKCDLRPFGCPAIYEKECDSADWQYVERVVAKWAVANPEPRYPTWGEWFAEQGELSANWKDLRVVSCSGKSSAGIIGLLYNEIPADIAQKLGIEPKEG